ncbi:Protein fam8a1 [Saguinus oedipus]|uniref:Protein fam8a1 n=1 Tax=Saguinus oedipus TaxID=9490 RepID=A0ABQ9VUD3_SAGOE|nr:Protein fam8a1 [Saguinus oedipus]
MAEGPEEARGRPPGQDEGGGDHKPVPSLRGPPTAAVPCPRDDPQDEPQAPGRPTAPGLAAAAAAYESESLRELGKRGEAASGSGAGPPEQAGCKAPEAAAPRERPARLSAREYSRQVHEWLWQSYCGYLTWHSGLAALPAYCSPQPSPQSFPSGGAAVPQATGLPPAPQVGYYNPFYFLSSGAAGPDPGTAAGLSTPAPVANLGPRAPQVQSSVRATPVTRVGSAAPSRSPSETRQQAGWA